MLVQWTVFRHIWRSRRTRLLTQMVAIL